MALKGAKRHRDRLKAMATLAHREVYAALYAGADIIRVEAVRSIVHGAIQGAGHIPSLPGEPPNRDTAQLDTSIIVEGDRPRMRVLVSANAPYAAALELGNASGTLAERPYMRPAAKKGRPQLLRLVTEAVKRANKKA